MMDQISEIIGPICALLSVIALCIAWRFYMQSEAARLAAENARLRRKYVDKELENQLLEVKCSDLANRLACAEYAENNKKTE